MSMQGNVLLVVTFCPKFFDIGYLVFCHNFNFLLRNKWATKNLEMCHLWPAGCSLPTPDLEWLLPTSMSLLQLNQHIHGQSQPLSSIWISQNGFKNIYRQHSWRFLYASASYQGLLSNLIALFRLGRLDYIADFNDLIVLLT